jgi:uncharacterized protein with FMN-binding domain
MRRVILAIVCTAAGLALLLSFKTRATPGLAAGAPITSTGQNGTSASPAPSPSAVSGSSGTSGSGGSGTSTAAGARTVAGDVVQTIYGPIQVTITVKDGRITAVNVPEYPDGTPEDMQINAYALPKLIGETVSSGSDSIDSVSGATYTSQGYLSSLQSAIDKAGL